MAKGQKRDSKGARGSMGQVSPAHARGWSMAGLQALSLASESARLVQLRTERIAQGGPVALAETWLMFAEKWQAAAELQAALLLTDAIATPLSATRLTLTHYRRKVRANRRRLAG